MLESLLVLQSHDSGEGLFLFVFSLTNHLTNVVRHLAVNPRSAEQARALTLVLAHDLAAIDAVVDERSLRGLTVAGLARRKLHLAQVTSRCFLCGTLVHALSGLGGLIRPDLDSFCLLVVAMLSLDPLDELLDESFDILAAEVQEPGDRLIDRTGILGDKLIYQLDDVFSLQSEIGR